MAATASVQQVMATLATVPCGLFALTSLSYTRYARKRCKRRRYMMGHHHITSNMDSSGSNTSTEGGSANQPFRRRYLPPPDDEIGRAIIDEVVADTIANATAKSSGSAAAAALALTSLSRRGQRAALPPMPPHWSAFIQCLRDPCDALHNPQGHIALCLAENRLVQELLANRLMNTGTAAAAFGDSAVYGYNGFLGLPAAREAVAYLLERRFLFAGGQRRMLLGSQHSSLGDLDATARTSNAMTRSNSEDESDDENDEPPQPRPASPGPDPDRIDPDHCALGAGVASLLSHVLHILAEPNDRDAVLIPAPYYSSFDNDLQALAGTVPWPVHMANPHLGPTVEELERAALRAEREGGLTVRALLLTNPNDPLGVVYRPKTMAQCIKWARGRRMHTVVDEIYALSVHRPREGGFESVVRVLGNELGDDVHLLYGLSKDFGASGFRVGMLYTQNTLLLASLSNLNIFSGISHPMQMVLAEILTDDDFLDGFLDDCRGMLLWSHTICVRKLDEMVVPYVPAAAGLSVYVDLSALLPERSWEGERRLAQLIERAARVVLTPGECMSERVPGKFRLCYSWVLPEVLEIAMERLSFLVKKIRRHGVDSLLTDANALAEVTKAGMQISMRRCPSINLAELTHHSNSKSSS